MQQKAIPQSLEDKRLREFYSLLYDFKYLIFIKKDYYNRDKRKIVSNYYYTNGINGLLKSAKSFHKSIYMSVCNKYPEHTEKDRARNSEENTAYANFFVVDLDTKYILNTNLANNIIGCLMIRFSYRSLSIKIPFSLSLSSILSLAKSLSTLMVW